MNYPVIEINQKTYSFSDITINSTLNLAKIKDSHYEAQLTAVLSSILGNEVDPLKLTVEERYCLFLSYLNLTIDKNSLRGKTDPLLYIANDLNAFRTERVHSKVMEMSVRHLSGMEATALEICCENTEDWILGELAITIGLDDRLPEIDLHTSLQFTIQTIANRINTVRKFSTYEFNEIYEEYLNLQYQQSHLVNIAFDKGIVLEKFSSRGADDAPCRFWSSHAVTGYAQELLSIALGGAAAVLQ